LIAIKQNYKYFRTLPANRQADRDMALEAAKYPDFAQYAPEIYKDDVEVLLTMVKLNLSALDFASARLKNDPAFVLEAQIAYFQAALERGEGALAKKHLRFCRPLWGQPDRIFGDVAEQISYLKEYYKKTFGPLLGRTINQDNIALPPPAPAAT